MKIGKFEVNFLILQNEKNQNHFFAGICSVNYLPDLKNLRWRVTADKPTKWLSHRKWKQFLILMKFCSNI